MKTKGQKEWESTLQETRLVTTLTCNSAQSFGHTKAPYGNCQRHNISDIRLQTHLAILVVSRRPAVQSVKGLATVVFQVEAQDVSRVCSASRVVEYRLDVPRMNVRHDQG